MSWRISVKLATRRSRQCFPSCGTSAGIFWRWSAATLAKLNTPTDVFDAAGNAYIADYSNRRIRKVSTSGVISTVAGNGGATLSGHGGAATSASVSVVTAVVALPNGDFYFRNGDGLIYKVTASSGIMTTAAGSSPFDDFSGNTGSYGVGLSSEGYLDADSDGNIFIPSNSKVYRLAASGPTLTLVAGSTYGFSGDGGSATVAQLRNVSAVSLSRSTGNLAIADPGNYRVRQVQATASVSVIDMQPALTPAETFGASNPALECDKVQACTDDPVNTATGNFWETFADVVVPGRGPALNLSRTYNALGASTNSAFGYGWTFNYGMNISIASGIATVTQENGSQTRFVQAGSTFTPEAPRTLATLVLNGDGTYTFVRKLTTTFTFDSAGRLTSIKDLNDYTTTVTRPSSTSMVITDSAGRTLSLTLSSSRVTAASGPGGLSTSYTYDGAGNLTDVIDVGGGHSVFTYDSSHRMLTKRAPKYYGDTTTTPSPVTTNTYDSQSRVLTQTDPIGRVSTFDYTTIPGSTKRTDAKGNVTLYAYDNYQLVSKTHAYGTSLAATTTYSFDPLLGTLTSVTDPLGRVTAMYYDTRGNLTRTVDPLDKTNNFTYDNLNNVLTATNALGQTSTFTYDTRGNLLTSSVTLTEPTPDEVETTTFTYGDSAHLGDVTSISDPLGHATTFVYNAYGDVTSATDAIGNKTTMAYNSPVSIGQVLSVVSPKGNVAGGTPSQYTTIIERNAFGQPTAVKDPLWSSGTPTAHKTVTVYDANGNATSTTDGLGKTTTYTYNPAGELLTTTRPDASTLKSEYWPDGSLKTQRDGANAATSYAYNALGQLTSTTDPVNRVTSYVNDLVGNVLNKIDHGGNCGSTPFGCTTYTYDARNQLKTVAYSDGTTPGVTYNYDALGRRSSMVDGTGTSTWTYDSLGRLVSSTDGASATVGYGYDRANRQTSVVYPGSKTLTRVFNNANQITSISDWLSHTDNFTYDADGHLLTKSGSSGVVATSTYDRAGQLSGVEHTISGWSLANYTATYDGAGQVNQLATGGYVSEPSVSYSYDQVNRLTGPSGTTYGYSNADNPTTVAGGVTQTFNAANELSTSTAKGGTTFNYDTRGNRTTVTPTNGYVTTHAYDQANRLKSVTSTASTPVAYSAAVNADSPGAYFRLNDPPQDNFFATNGLYYGFLSGSATRQAPGGLRGDADTSLNFWNGTGQGWLPSLPVNTAAGGDTTIEFLMRWDGSTTSTDVPFAFESNYMLALKDGNIGFSTKSDISDLYGTSANNFARRWVHVVAVFRNGSVTGSKLYIDGQLQTLSQVAGTPVSSPQVHTAGSISGTDNGTNHMNGNIDELAIYNSALSATRVAAHYASTQNYTATYTYNGDGTRASKTTGGVTETFVWDQTTDLPMLLKDSTNYYVYGPDGLPLSQIRIADTATHWFSQDTLGNTRMLVDPYANKAAQFSYDAYGNVTAAIGRMDTPFKYRGEYQDKETGYLYLRARYYDPTTTQFLTRDPLVSVTRSAYGYVNADPLNGTDPSGLFVDVLADIAFVAYDVYQLVSDGQCDRDENLTALGLDTVSAFIPFATGTGAASRVGREAGEKTAVIGRQADTAIAREWKGYEVLDLPPAQWSLEANDQWVKSVIDRKMAVYVGSNPVGVNIWDVGERRPTVFARELKQFEDAGYTWDGWTLVPPAGG